MANVRQKHGVDFRAKVALAAFNVLPGSVDVFIAAHVPLALRDAQGQIVLAADMLTRAKAAKGRQEAARTVEASKGTREEMDILKVVLEQWNRIAGYFAMLMHMFVAPKTVLSEISPKDKPDISGSLAFLTISFLIQALVFVPLLRPEQRSIVTISCLILLSVCGTIPFALGIHLAWRVVGGSAPFVSSFAISAYLAGVATMIIMFGMLAETSLMMAIDYSLYAALMHHMEAGINLNASELTISQMAIVYVGNAVLFLFFLVALLWFMAGWGAYRRIYQVSRLRSGIAFATALLLEIPVFLLILLVAYALWKYILHVG